MNLEQRQELTQAIAQLQQENTLGRNGASVSRYRENISHLLGLSNIEGIAAIVLMSGLYPGTGSSTAKRLLSEVLKYSTEYDSGFYRRVLAQHWSSFYSEHGGRTLENWRLFQQMYFLNGADTFTLETLQVAIAKSKPEQFTEEELSIFNTDQRNFANNLSLKWDRIPDTVVYDQIITKQQGVWQGKLTAIIDHILAKPDLSLLGIPLLRILLEVNPKVAARRVAMRDGISTLNGIEQIYRSNQERYDRDWKQYQELYGITPDTFRSPQILRVDTTVKTPSEVVAIILLALLEKIKG